jgi:hypothetical protein
VKVAALAATVVALLAAAVPRGAGPAQPGTGALSAPAPLAQVPAFPADTANGCLACHAAERQAATEGVHAQHGVTCVSCHGGDPTARTLPAGHSGHFLGTPDKVATAELCGSCHSDPNKMREYGLPTGQLAQFRTSQHGRLLFGQHNDDVPTCTDCHGTHIIYPPYDARSRVYPSNIPGTCAHCHSDQKLMAKYRLRTDQFEQYQRSAHGVALFQDQNFAAPTCVGCHGAHSELPPTVTEIASVCGRCHVLVEQQFALGPHGPAARAGKLPGCLGCHSNHGTEPVPADSISATCTKCHATNSKVHQFADDLQHRMVQATADIQSAQRAISELAAAGERVGYYRFRYQSALTYYRQIAEKQHRLNLDTLDALALRVRSVSVDLDAQAEASRENRWEHRLLLLPVWFLSLSAVALALLALRSLRGTGESSDTPET